MKMNSFIAGICLFFSSLFSCQQKGDFKSVSVEDFSTLIANPEMQRLDVRTLAEYSNLTFQRASTLMCLIRLLPKLQIQPCKKIDLLPYIAVVANAVRKLLPSSARKVMWFMTLIKVSKNGRRQEKK